MQKIPYNAALALLLSFGLCACSINTGKGSQGDTTARTTSLVATNNSGSNTSDNNESNSNNADSNASNNSSSSNNNPSDGGGSVNSDNSTDNNPSDNGSANSNNSTDNNPSDNGSANTSGSTNTQTSSSEFGDKTESTLNSISAIGVNGSYAATYLTSLKEQDELFTAVQQANNLTAGSCTAIGGRNAANHPCSVGSVAEGGIIGSYTLKDSNGQSLGAYAVIREAYSERENPTNSYIAMINTPTTERSAVVNATYHGVASYSFNNRPNMATRDFELNVTDNSVSGSAYYIAATGNRVTAVTFESGQIGEEFGNITFSGKTTFNNNLLPGLGNSEGRYQGWFVGQNAEGVVGTFSTSSQGSNASVQGAFAAQK